MSTVAIPESLTSLVDFLNQLTTRVPIEGLREHLSKMDVTIEDLRPFMQFDDCSYRRNLICENTWYELLCICWKNGQASPIHNHAQSTCGLRVIHGAGIETTFELDEHGRARPVSERRLEVGDVCCTQDADIHQVANNQPDDKELVTLHIYSPPLRTMQTWERSHDH